MACLTECQVQHRTVNNWTVFPSSDTTESRPGTTEPKWRRRLQLLLSAYRRRYALLNDGERWCHSCLKVRWQLIRVLLFVTDGFHRAVSVMLRIEKKEKRRRKNPQRKQQPKSIILNSVFQKNRVVIKDALRGPIPVVFDLGAPSASLGQRPSSKYLVYSHKQRLIAGVPICLFTRTKPDWQETTLCLSTQNEA